MKMFRLLACLLLLFFYPDVNNTYAGSVDSLLNIINTTSTDTTKINTLVELSHQLRNTDAKQAFNYAQRALKLSEKADFTPGVSNSHNELRILFYNERNFTEAFIHGKLVYDYEVAGTDNYKKGKAAYALGNIFYKQNNYGESLKWYLQALKFYELNNSKYEMGITQEIIGAVFLSLEELDNAEQYYVKSLNTATSINDSIGIASGFSNLGIVNGHLKKYKEAFEEFNKAINILIQLKDTAQLIQVLNNMGITYKKAGLYNDALMQYQFCAKLISYSQPIDSVALNYVNMNVGVLYTKMGNNLLARQYLDHAVAYSFQLDDINLRSEAYSALY